MEEIGAYAAKTHFPKLLDRVSEGESVLITRRGKPVAKLVPAEDDHRKRAEAAVRRMEQRRREVVGASLEELIASVHEGHRY